jgi:excisionase family DNA binding protein
VYRRGERAERGEFTLNEAARELGVSKMTVLRLIQRNILAAYQACKRAPWVIRQVDLQAPAVKQAAAGGIDIAVTPDPDQGTLEFQ